MPSPFCFCLLGPSFPWARQQKPTMHITPLVGAATYSKYSFVLEMNLLTPRPHKLAPLAGCAYRLGRLLPPLPPTPLAPSPPSPGNVEYEKTFDPSLPPNTG